MTVGFGPEEEIFRYSVFIVLINRLVTCVVAYVALQAWGLPTAPSAPLLLFAIPSVANVVGSSAQYEALKYVSFPLQALSKCAKSVRALFYSFFVTSWQHQLPPGFLRVPCYTWYITSITLSLTKRAISFYVGACDGMELDYKR